MQASSQPAEAADPYAGMDMRELVAAALAGRARGLPGYDVFNERGVCGVTRVWLGYTSKGFARVHEFHPVREADAESVRLLGPARASLGLVVANPYEPGWKRAWHGGVEWF